MDFRDVTFTPRIMCVLCMLRWGRRRQGSSVCPAPGVEVGGRIIAQVVEISSRGLDGQRDGLRFKSYMRDVMSGKFRDVIH